MDPLPTAWQEKLKLIVRLMRDLSLQTDPQSAALMYGRRLRDEGLVPSEQYIGLSRRNVQKPHYRITRSTRWTDPVNPWQQPEKLPQFDRGLLGELAYAEEPQIISDLHQRLQKDDPAYDYLEGFEFAASIPHYDNGEALNTGVLLWKDAKTFPVERLPVIVWQANLWGRAVNNLVLRQELEKAFDRLKATHAALDREMATVGQVQRTLLPKAMPKWPGADFAVHYQTSERAGGDYYDFFGCEDGRCGILIADVSGHGAPAAVLMAVTHALAQLHPGAGFPPAEMLAFLNENLTKRYTSRGSFVTAFYAIFDQRNRKLTFSNAGHPPPRIVRNGKVIIADGVSSLPLGIEPDETYRENSLQLEPGDKLIFYTDGITEARNKNTELYGFDRLDQTLASIEGESAHWLAMILASVKKFADGRPPDDDRTLIVMGV